MIPSSSVSHSSKVTLFPSQYRTFDRIYLLKVQKDGSPLLKIYDISQQRLYQQSILDQDLNTPALSSHSSLRPTLKSLIQSPLLPLEHRPTSTQPTTAQACQQAAIQAIQYYKPCVLAEPKEIKDCTCPITLDVFQNPVIDNHGHTFEESAIKTHLKNSNLCPLSKEPITSLTPNRLLKQTIESYQQQEPIPNFSLFKKENPKLALTSLQSAQSYLEEEEYDESLDSYTKAFQYTRDWRHYASLPLLFQKMQQPEKAILGYLYLASYQLQESSVQEAIQTLESCQEQRGTPRHVDLLLIQLYHLNHQPEKALELSQKAAQALTKDHPEQAILLYRHILMENPQEIQLYLPLSQLIPSLQEKAHVLFLGACHALEASNYQAAQSLCDEAQKHLTPSFIDTLLSLENLDTPDLKERLTLLAEKYEKRNLPHQALRAYKLLFQLEEKAETCEKIVLAYQTLQKERQHNAWSMQWLSILIENKNWPAAERVAQTVLERASEEKKIPLYETLETIYTHWQGHKLENLWMKLGEAQLKSGQLQAAEKTYRKAYERFHLFEQAIALAEILKEQGNIPQSVQMYYEASSLALMDGRLDKLERCIRPIKEIDPSMQYLKTSKRMQLLAQRALLELSQELQQAKHRLQHSEQGLQQANENQEKLTQDLQGTREKVRLLEEKVSLIERGKAEKIARKQQEVEAAHQKIITQFAFGAAKWNEYFGKIGVEPPLPSNIREILSSPCPFWPGKKVQETHLLVLIPQAVNGKPLTLKSLGEFVKVSKQGHKTQYRYFDIGGYTDPPAPASRWVLMTRDVLEGSRNKSYSDQQALVASHAQKSGIPYQVPNTLDAAICIFLEYVQSGVRLYSDQPWTYTRCQEKYNENYQLVVGGFAAGGLSVYAYYDSGNCGVGVLRKF